VKRPTQPRRFKVAELDSLVEERGPVRIHAIAGQVAAVVHLSGVAFCAVATSPFGGHLIAFNRELLR